MQMPPSHQRPARAWSWALIVLPGLLSGCEMLGIELPGATAAKKVIEGKAIGSACRHAIRSIEDCFRVNAKADKAAIFEGWREMDAYMRENNIEGMPFKDPPPEPPPPPPPPEQTVSPAEEVLPPETKGKGEKTDKSEKADKAGKTDRSAAPKH